MLNSLLVLAGAIVGLAGGVFASIYGQYRQSKREKYKELRSNLLVMALEIGKIHAWAQKQGNYYSNCPAEEYQSPELRNHPALGEPYPTQKIQAIVSLYFPDILEDADELANAALAHQSTAVDLLQARFRLTRGEGSQKIVDGKFEIMCGAFENLVKKQMRFEEVARERMAKLLKEKS
ncbi:MAG: hypothetical protein MPJ22_09495 [Pirellulales bacterium]|nr:hypothetical protein [Gammaproteobacteria bacterium]MDA8010381.1 hypothetical protein [Alphaproteobacteria bacterium]MDA8042637.1 hypothetical protein [Pirellulales bacterium]